MSRACFTSPHVLLLPEFSFSLSLEMSTRPDAGKVRPALYDRSYLFFSELLILTRNLTFMVLARCAGRSMSRVSERGIS